MSYDLRRIVAPRLTGRALAVFCAALERPGLRGALMRKLERDAGFTDFRQQRLDEPPTVAPPLPRRATTIAADDPQSRRPLSLDALVDEDAPRALEGPEGPESAASLTRRYRSGELSPVAVAERFLENVRASDGERPPLRAVIAFDGDDIMTQARASARRWRDGAPRSPLDGVPVLVKDELDVLGYPTTVGTRFLGQEPMTRDATVVARVRAAGALIVGKANMHEIGIGVTGLNPHHGTPRNPYDPTRFTGGSSSGSAAAVAAGLCPAAIGADGGGSIRIPAALCGVVGLKPTWSRVSEHGAFPLCWSVGHVGPIGATVRDCALLYAAFAGEDPKDSLTHGQPSPRCVAAALTGDSLDGLSIGAYEPYLADAEPDIVSACERVIAELEARGATRRAITIEHLELCRVAHVITIASEMLLSMGPFLKTRRRELGLDVRINLAIAAGLSATDYIAAQRARARVSRHWAELLRPEGGVDIIVTPSTGVTAPPIRADALARGESDLVTLSRVMRFAPPANLTGFPAISVPAGYDARGLPIGVQLTARPWAEHTLLRVAAVIERASPRQRPRRRYSLLG